MKLTTWAMRHGVGEAALAELCEIMGTWPGMTGDSGDHTSEAGVQKAVQLEASRLGGRLFRNNVGALKDERGVPIRYGLANESKEMNKVVKSSDLIGIRPINIGGKTIGQFVAREMKEPGWKYCGNEHERAQLKFIELINKLGGDAQFCTGVGTL